MESKPTYSGDLIIKDIRSDNAVPPGNYPNTLICEPLDELAPHSNSDLAKKMNEIIRKTNKYGN